MKIEVAATGKLKRFVPEKTTMDVKEGITLNELKAECGFDSGVTCGFTVNNRIARGGNQLADGDSVRFLMVVGAG